jgi:hypothetical protein
MEWNNLHMAFSTTTIRLVMPLGLLFLCPLYAVAPASQSLVNAQQAKHQQITVKIRNGNTSRPIWLASPYVFLGNPDPNHFQESYRRTKFWNDARVDVTGVMPREVRVWVDFINRDCRFADGDTRFRTFDFGGNTLNGIGAFDLDTILSTGIVAPNLCSAKTEHPEPGVLTIYVIPATFKELWDS